MKSLKIKPKTDTQLEKEMKNLILGKHRMFTKEWILQKSLHAIQVQQNLKTEELIQYAIKQHKQNHKDLYTGKKTIDDISKEAKQNIEQAKQKGIL